MLKTDYTYSKVKIEDLEKYQKKINDIVTNFKNKTCVGNEYTGWYEYIFNIDETLISSIKLQAADIVKKYDTFVVCGIGGSYLGARAVIEAIKGFKKSNIEIIYIGNTFDKRYTVDVMEYLKTRNFCVNVISKSGSTLETAYAFRLLKNVLIQKYGEKYTDRIYATTDKKNGCLRKMAEKNNYFTYEIPNNIGGRYSVFTPVGLLPIAVAGIDIEQFVNGAKKAIKDFEIETVKENIAYQYAAYRHLQHKQNNKLIEIFSTYSPYLSVVSEWWKQLFGESEGKNGDGIFPASVNFSTDLHSLGQYIQEGKKIFFMTQVKVAQEGKLSIVFEEENEDNLNYLVGMPLQKINLKAQEGTSKAHYSYGGVDNFVIEIDEINEFNVGYMLFLLMYSCMISANLIGVNPFDQPGVEFYKKEMKNLLKN